MSYKKEYQKILEFVQKYRAKHKINPTPGYKPEGSGINYGEGYLLLYSQLIYTPEGLNGWNELKDEEVRKLVLDEIEKCENRNNQQ